MVKVGILGAAGYTGGELLRVLINHPEVEIVFANSESNAGNAVAAVHEGLLGDTDLCFTDQMPFDQVDVVFFCFGHGKSEAFLKEHEIPEHVKIIDLAQDFRVGPGHWDGMGDCGGKYVYGLPEIHREQIQACQHLANPGCFATCIQLGLLPLAKAGLLTNDIAVNAITGSTGAGQKPGATTHFSWRNDNFSVYKLFTHQHLHEICQTLNEIAPLLSPQGGKMPRCIDTLDEGYPTADQSSPLGKDHPTADQSSPLGGSSQRTEGLISLQREDELQRGAKGGHAFTLDFIPYRGDFARGIFCTEVVKLDQPFSKEEVVALYKDFYQDAAFTHYSDAAPDLKQVVGTNKALVHVDVFGRKVVITSIIDNLLKGAVGQAVQNMNLMFGLPEKEGLLLKAIAF